MEPIFSLGIGSLWDELQHMPAGGLWWLNLDRSEDAVSLLNQTLYSQHAKAKVGVIVPFARPKDIVKQYVNHGPEKTHLFSMLKSQEALKSLPHDLMCSVNPKHYLFIMLLSDNCWVNTSSDKLHSWLTDLDKWARHCRCTLLILNPGNKSDNQLSLLISEYRTLSGLATLRYLGESWRYDVAFWSNEKGVSAQQQIHLLRQNDVFNIIEAAEMTPQPRSDEKRVLSHIAVLEGAPPLSENWQLFDSNEALFDKARTAQAATIIFSLSQNNQIDSIAHQIHTLRRQRGSALKLIVRENNTSLRATDERLLLGCGATLIIPWNAPLSRCLTMIESVQGQQFSRYVPEDISVLIDRMQPLKIRGYQHWDVFCHAVSTLMDNTLLPQDSKGVMVALRPVPGLRVEQALTLCRTNRTGDIITLGENRLMLFLSFCRINDLETALNHIFPLPANEIFSNRMVWYEDKQIAAEIVQMQAMTPEKWVRPLAAPADISTARNVHRAGDTRRRVPTPVTLLDTPEREQSQ